MSKLKKVLIMCTAYVLVIALAIGGTVAYLQETDSDVNVMTLGNVSIVQHEYERAVDADGNYTTIDVAGTVSYELKEFAQGKPLYPMVGDPNDGYDSTTVRLGQLGHNSRGDMDVLPDANVQDKFVVVENTGKTDAYVRTLVAFEAGSVAEEDWYKLVNYTTHFTWKETQDWFVVEIEGNNYYVAEFVYNGYEDIQHPNGVLKPGDYTYNSLAQVYMFSHATNEDVEVLDGDDDGEFDILVLSQAVQAAGFADVKAALDAGFGAFNEENVAKWFGGVIAEHSADTWDGTADFALFGLPRNATPKDIKDAVLEEDEYIIGTAEELAAFSKLVDAGQTFEDKTIVLDKDIDLANKLFDPIGSYRFDKSFKGTFDGQNHTISNLSQNTWALDNGYAYNDCGLGLFGAVEDGAVKNLTIDGADISGESAICGTVAAVAHNATFENVTVKNANVADYQYYAGGIVGWASGKITIKDVNVDTSTTVAAQWGDFDNSTGGVIGGASGNAEILMKDTTVACRIDAYNDVTSSYQWYAYRRCGMLIGNSGKTITENERTSAAAPQLTCENVTVIYGDWANYTYCEFAGTSWPYVRVQAGVSNSAYSNPRYGHPTDANGNEVVDDNHVHNEGEDHFILCEFDQLYGGGQGVYGTATHNGVTVIYNNK